MAYFVAIGQQGAEWKIPSEDVVTIFDHLGQAGVGLPSPPIDPDTADGLTPEQIADAADYLETHWEELEDAARRRRLGAAVELGNTEEDADAMEHSDRIAAERVRAWFRRMTEAGLPASRV